MPASSCAPPDPTGAKPTGKAARERIASDGKVRAPLPATVVGIHLTVGARVERGQPLITLSAMKMELTCDAPVAGVVESIACQVGELVSADHLLVMLRPVDAVS